MDALISKGYALRVPKSELPRSNGKVCYLSHHPVIKPNDLKPQIVFNCADQYKLGMFLNFKVLQGPDLTNKLVGVLTRFRLYPVVLMADIEATFHQLCVQKQDRDVLWFLWWPQGNVDRPPA